jgi:ubiquinone/menaquinone biosynthesis C-methylase UbiE
MSTPWKNTFDSADPELVDALDEVPFWSAPFGLKLLETVRMRKNMTVLDVGSGTGYPLIELASRLGDTCTLYGIDPWPAANARAKKKIVHFGIQNIQLLETEAEKIPLEDNSIDLVVSNNGLNNVRDMKQVLREVARVLKPEGQFVMTMNLNSTMLEFYGLYREILEEWLDIESEEDVASQALVDLENHIYKRRRPLPEVEKMLEDTGFEISDIQHDRFDYRFTDGTTLLNHHIVRISFLPGWKAIVPEERQDALFRELEARMNAIAEKQGEISLRVPFVCIDCNKK